MDGFSTFLVTHFVSLRRKANPGPAAMLDRTWFAGSMANIYVPSGDNTIHCARADHLSLLCDYRQNYLGEGLHIYIRR